MDDSSLIDSIRDQEPERMDSPLRRLTYATAKALQALELCMGHDLRENGCACGSRHAEVCYLHGVIVPDAISGLRAALKANREATS